MSGRNRSDLNFNNEWDTLREEHNNSSYEPQFGDEPSPQHDHCRLYIRNIPKGLSDDGLRTAFSKYGTLTEVHLSKDPLKKYALVRYETPGEAKLAMTKLHNTEPMKFSISIAYKPKKKDVAQDGRSQREYRDTERNFSSRSIRDDNSVSSRDKSFKQFEDMGDAIGDSLPAIGDDLDPDTKMKGLQLELERLQVQEQAVLLKQRLWQLEQQRKNLTQSNSTSNRCILPDGRIQVQNVKDRNMESRDVDGTFAAGAGDSLTLPALQRAASRSCVACGAAADSYCAQCGVTPYCSVACQRRDWADRHRSVCHSLARQPKLTESSDAVLNNIPNAAPLRRPRSPVNHSRRDNNDKMQKSKQSPAQNNYSKFNGRSNNNNDRSFSRPGNNRAQPKNESPEDEEDWGNAKNKPATPSQPPAKDTPKEPAPAPRQEIAPAPRQEIAPVPKPASAPTPKAEVKPPAKLNEVMPVKKIVPKNYVIELLPIGDKVLLSVDAIAADCRSTKPGFICLTMHETYQAQYQALIETYVVACDADNEEYTPKPGESFSYFNPEDSGWYRARCLSDKQAALLDSSKLVDIQQAKVKKLAGDYVTYPEFCCLLNADKIKVGDSLSCTIVSKTADSIRVSLENIESGSALGQGEVSRWLPTVDYPTLPSPSIQPALPEVPRPELLNNCRVFLVDATALDCVFVRPADTSSQRKYDAVLQDAVLYGRSANPLKEPPLKGQVVIAKFTDGLHYRAMCKRTSVKQNKYMLEYIDFGNTEISQLENLYACPPNLDLPVTPTEASRATLQCSWAGALSKPAIDYLNTLKDENVELTLTLPSGAKSAASGSAITLTVVKSNENVNRKVQELCTPDWKEIEENGGDVVELECLHYKLLEYPELPSGGCELDISDVAGLDVGVLSGCPKNLPHALHVMTTLTQRIADYCNSELGREPYLPKSEELCIAPCPPYPQWFRAVLMEHFTGSPTAKVCYVDYGNVDDIEVKMIRKMLPEFVRGEPALAIHIEIRDFPKPATGEMIARAINHLQLDDGRGTLKVTRCEKIEHGMYIVDAPDFLRAVLGK